jgi:hypothetical protein
LHAKKNFLNEPWARASDSKNNSKSYVGNTRTRRTKRMAGTKGDGKTMVRDKGGRLKEGRKIKDEIETSS